MASASPAIPATRPTSWVDLRRQAEYPIILGDSLKENGTSANHFLNVRLNYQPKTGFGSQRGNLSTSNEKYRLTVPVDDKDGSNDANYVFSGKGRHLGDEKSRSLALVFDKAKSAFVLEDISTSVDLNLISAPGRSTQYVRGLPQLSSKQETEPVAINGDKSAAAVEDEDVDASNPFDFRHFLNEARENADKPSHNGGSRTPLPGNRTPLSGLSSPNPSATRIRSSTPQFRPTQKIAPTSAPVPKKRKVEDNNRIRQTDQTTVTATNRKHKAATTSSKHSKSSANNPLSKEKVSDSDSDTEGNANDELRSLPTTKASKPNSKPGNQTHSRTDSSTSGSKYIRSPHIVVNDGDLEIDMGSPPRSSRYPDQGGRARHHRIDPEAFRSHTGTPSLGRSPNPQANRLPTRDHDTIERSDDDDDDIEKLELGSPRAQRVAASSSSVVVMDEGEDRPGNALLQLEDETGDAPTPPVRAVPVSIALVAADDEDEDEDEDLLAKELEAALGEEDDDDDDDDDDGKARGRGSSGGGGLGLGIMDPRNANADEDESEVSEEE